MTLADISIKRPVFAWMLFWGIILFGTISFRNLGISQMPDVDFPVIAIQLTLQGASPEVMETNVVDILEDSLLSVEGITQIQSTSSYGQARITIELDLSRDVDVALQEVQTKISQVQKLLPTTLEAPIITKTNPEDVPILWLAITSEGNTRDLMVYVRDVLKSQFSVVPGVSQIQLGGFADRNLRIWVDDKKIKQYELTVDDVSNAVIREHAEDPAGLIENSSFQKSIRSMGESETVTQFSNIRIPSRGGAPILGKLIYLKDVATVEDGLEDIKRISRFNRARAVGIGIQKQRGTNAVEVARAVKAKMKILQSQLPPGFKIDIPFDSSIFIEDSIAELEFTLLLSILLTALVCFFFLGSWSSTWNILLSIPTSIIGSLFFIDLFGFTLNTFTLLALSLAIGIVVDDAIMVLENIVRHRELGQDMVSAARKGAREITFAAIATTLSITAIFLPVIFIKGVVGRYFFQFGITISAAVFLSLIEALTLTPMRASRYLNMSMHQSIITRPFGKFLSFLDRYYEKLLAICLNQRVIVLTISLLVFVISFFFFFPLKKEFVPSMDQSRIMVRVQSQVTSSMFNMDQIAKVCEEALLKHGEVSKVFSTIGGQQGGQSNLAIFMVTLKDPKDRPYREDMKKKLSQNEFAAIVRKDFKNLFPKLIISVQDLSTRGFIGGATRGYPIEMNIQGPNWDTLAEVSEKLREEMKASPYFTDVDSSYTEGAPEVLVYPNRIQTAVSGVSQQSIGTTMGALFGGIKVGQFTDGGHRYDIRVKLKPDEREKPEQIKNLQIRNQRGELVSLSNLIELKEKIALPSITRINRSRSITLYANPSPKYGQKQASEEFMKMAARILPQEYIASPTGSTQNMESSFNSLYIALIIGILVAYMILGTQFNSFSQPILVLLALPFSFSGAIFSLWLFDYSLNIYSFIALLLLMGLVKKNSILLVDFTNQWREKGKEVDEALLIACPTRLRPILMTSFATIAAAVPPALALGPGSESRIPMAIAIIGGMLISTLLTLLVVPVGYSLFYKKRVK